MPKEMLITKVGGWAIESADAPPVEEGETLYVSWKDMADEDIFTKLAAAAPGNDESSIVLKGYKIGIGHFAHQLIVQAVKAGIWFPIEIVIARPFIEHLMLSAIVTVAGRDTGATLFGPAGEQYLLCVLLHNVASVRSVHSLFQRLCVAYVFLRHANFGQHICEDDRRHAA
jgi:hypothetical protein